MFKGEKLNQFITSILTVICLVAAVTFVNVRLLPRLEQDEKYNRLEKTVTENQAMLRENERLIKLIIDLNHNHIKGAIE